MTITPVRGPALRPQSRPAQKAEEQPVDTVELQKLLPENPFFIPQARVEQITSQLGITTRQLLQALVPLALPLAHADVSQHRVGQAALGESGNVYLSVNVEFPGADPQQTIHGEQFMVANALAHGETRILEAALTGCPCGNCRQFLAETNQGADMNLILYNKTPELRQVKTLAELNPEPFGSGGSLLTPQHVPLTKLVENDNTQVTKAAFAAAQASYIRKYPTASGVALKLEDGTIVKGSYLEISGHNPSLSPLRSALARMVAEGRPWSSIRSVALVEEQGSPFSQEANTRALLKTVAPDARLRVRHAER